MLKDYSGLFSSGDTEEPTNENESERKQRLAEQKKADKWSWFLFAYTLGKGDALKMKEVLSLNLIFLLNFKSCELENKQIFEHYDFNRFNLR